MKRDETGAAIFYCKGQPNGLQYNLPETEMYYDHFRSCDNCIRANLYHVSGAAVTNFDNQLPVPQGKLAQELLKGSYDLGFIALPGEYDEDALETAIEQRMTRFLLELGEG